MKAHLWTFFIICGAGVGVVMAKYDRSNTFPFPTGSMEIKMPYVHPEKPETYLCTPVKLDPTRTNFIVGFRPQAEAKIAHHMLLYGCKAPGAMKPVYNCGDMAIRQEDLPSARHPCGRGNSIVYAWAKNAPELNLPEGVGFRVGGPDAEIDWLVLQVHYASVKHIPPEGDTSGVEIIYTNREQPRSAGVLLLATRGRIPAQSTTHMDVSCAISDHKIIHPFAFRVHTHALGTAVSGWKVQGGNKWRLLGKEDPQLPQMFFPVSDKNETLSRGDVVAARCTMKNDQDHAVWVGATRENEMCNFYLMYWVDGPKVLNQKRCTSSGPPLYSWGGWWIFGGGLSNIPEVEASSL